MTVTESLQLLEALSAEIAATDDPKLRAYRAIALLVQFENVLEFIK